MLLDFNAMRIRLGRHGAHILKHRHVYISFNIAANSRILVLLRLKPRDAAQSAEGVRRWIKARTVARWCHRLQSQNPGKTELLKRMCLLRLQRIHIFPNLRYLAVFKLDNGYIFDLVVARAR